MSTNTSSVTTGAVRQSLYRSGPHWPSVMFQGLLALSLLQGLLLLHPPSKALFSRDIYMNVRLVLSFLLLPSPHLPLSLFSVRKQDLTFFLSLKRSFYSTSLNRSTARESSARRC